MREIRRSSSESLGVHIVLMNRLTIPLLCAKAPELGLPESRGVKDISFCLKPDVPNRYK